jgi:hypothetical protein
MGAVYLAQHVAVRREIESFEYQFCGEAGTRLSCLQFTQYFDAGSTLHWPDIERMSNVRN